MDVASLADLLHETSERHGSFEAVAPPHDWWDWYAAYMDSAPGRGRRGSRALHGGGQERRRLDRLTCAEVDPGGVSWPIDRRSSP